MIHDYSRHDHRILKITINSKFLKFLKFFWLKKKFKKNSKNNVLKALGSQALCSQAHKIAPLL